MRRNTAGVVHHTIKATMMRLKQSLTDASNASNSIEAFVARKQIVAEITDSSIFLTDHSLLELCDMLTSAISSLPEKDTWQQRAFADVIDVASRIKNSMKKAAVATELASAIKRINFHFHTGYERSNTICRLADVINQVRDMPARAEAIAALAAQITELESSNEIMTVFRKIAEVIENMNDSAAKGTALAALARQFGHIPSATYPSTTEAYRNEARTRLERLLSSIEDPAVREAAGAALAGPATQASR